MASVEGTVAGGAESGDAGACSAEERPLARSNTGSGSTAREPAVELPESGSDEAAAEPAEGLVSSAESALSMSSARKTAVPVPGGVRLCATGADSVEANDEVDGAETAGGSGARGRDAGSGSEARSSLNSNR
jgi:hypothetical protein